MKQNVFRSLDPKTGRPDVDPARKPGTGKEADFCPSHWGGKNWPPIAFSPKTRMIYIPANENLCGSLIGRLVEYTAGRSFTGATNGGGPYGPWGRPRQARCRPGMWIPVNGSGRNNYAKSPNWGPMLATAGGLVFSGGTNDRLFHAFDASTGKLLWEFPTNSGILAPPTSFAIDGKQYIAVQSGWGGTPGKCRGF